MHRLGYVLSDGFQLMALSTQSVFEFANFVLGDAFYELRCYSEAGGEVRSSTGVPVLTRPLREMQARHPAIRVEEDRLFIVDGALWTSAGMSAALDLALAMVEADLGEDVARSVAKKLVMAQRRTGGQSQHSELLDLVPKSDRVQRALDYARAHLKQALSVEDLAEVAHLSPRQFSRVFTAETGLSPAKAVEGLRLEAARLMIEQSRHPLEVVARETGFRDRRHLREVFIRKLGVPPQATRRSARV
jgi:transcriptional regulator GlxA family with amidase domain